MLIKANKIIFDEDSESYKIIEFVKCCDDIIKNKCIELNYEWDNIEDKQIYSVKMVENTIYHSEWEDYPTESSLHYKIDYCPHCGEKIEILIVDTINKDKEYSELVSKREYVWDECRNTDSIKKKDQLLLERNILDKEINSYYYSDGFVRGE